MASSNFINKCKQGAYCDRLGEIDIYDDESSQVEETLTQSNKLQQLVVKDGCYDNGTILGTVFCKSIDIELVNALDVDIINRKMAARVGIDFGQSNEFVSLGKYFASDSNDGQTTNLSSISGFDSLKANLDTPYVSNIDYSGSVTLADLFADVCNQLGLDADSSAFTNSTIPISDNPFTNNETCRFVLQTIGKIACCFVIYDEANDYVTLKWLSTNNSPDYTFQLSDYSNFNGGKKIYGPINSLVIKNSEVDSASIYRNDDESIAENGLHQLVISEDYILYDDSLRNQAIDNIWAKVHGLTYVDCELTSYYGKPFLNVGDKIRIYTDANTYYDTYVLTHEFTYDGAFTSVIKAPVISEQEAVNTPPTISEAIRRTELIVNKQEGTITSLVSETEVISGQSQTALNTATAANNLANNVNNDLQGYKTTVSTQFQQTSSSFEMQFNNVTDLINQVGDTESEHYDELHKYIRFVNGVIILGEEGNQLTAELSNTKLSFKQNGTEIAYVSNNKLYITNAEILTNVIIGNFEFTPRNNGSLSFRKVS